MISTQVPVCASCVPVAMCGSKDTQQNANHLLGYTVPIVYSMPLSLVDMKPRLTSAVPNSGVGVP